MKRIFIIFILCLSIIANAEFERTEVSISNLALSGAGTAFINGVQSIHVNPAALADLEGAAFYSYQTDEFSLEEFNTTYVAFTSRISNYGTFALSSLDFGNDDYNENTFTITFAKKMFDNANLGINIKKLNSNVKNTPKQEATAFDFSFTGEMNNTKYAFVVRNMNVPTLNDVIQRSIQIGFDFKVSEKSDTLIDLYKIEGFGDSKRTTSFSIGQVFRLGDNLKIYGGYSNKPYKISGGFSFKLNKKWDVDYAFSSHNYLPVTHAVAFTMNI